MIHVLYNTFYTTTLLVILFLNLACLNINKNVQTAGFSHLNKNDNKASIVKLYKQSNSGTNTSQKFDPKLAWKKIAQIYKGLRKYSKYYSHLILHLKLILYYFIRNTLYFLYLYLSIQIQSRNDIIPK